MSEAQASSSTNTSAAEPPQDPLHPDKLFSSLYHVLPRQASGTGAPQALLKTSADLTMSFFHAAMLNLGFRFLGLGESRVDNESQDLERTEAVQTPLPADWNAMGDMYSFRYKHAQSAFTFLLKGVKIGNRLVVHGMAIEDGKLHTLELELSTFISSDFKFPFNAPSNATSSTAGSSEQSSNVPDALRSAFASDEQLYEVIREFRIRIVQQLIPGLNKPGYEEWKPSQTSQAPTQETSGGRNPLRDNRHQPRPIHPGHADPFVGSGVGGSGPMYPPRGPYSVGDVDLDPLGVAPGLIPPSRFPGGYMGGGGMHPGGGMFVGPDHPMFTGGGGGVPRPGPYAGPDGSRLPPGAVPPGARFDPITPFGPAPGSGPRGPRGPFGPPGGGSGSGGFHFL
ncbi:hypothetical protein, variant [Spizellomyces punctatus DAOM BR117]|uniref:Uncharacterized protein n=1 Tax=Spizellomyces punctatus (strain DAOM BR117) TaxID=645134 RepID=A0A0L0HS77_SPIPD|nr:hypothetical protein, variant [Spizellomyces punctatus DAOM BR117]KND03978.1 hypothetical protein, variant [Spizellomyces punctatus DAOM BR117]|eukprot:XP_016612017.1 hypothetical protein, variant [Spizellomyces punctatus DAOM BR117]